MEDDFYSQLLSIFFMPTLITFSILCCSWITQMPGEWNAGIVEVCVSPKEIEKRIDIE